MLKRRGKQDSYDGEPFGSLVCRNKALNKFKDD